MSDEELLFWLHNWFSQYPMNTSDLQNAAMLQIISSNSVAFTSFVKDFRGEVAEAREAELTDSLAAVETELEEIAEL